MTANPSVTHETFEEVYRLVALSLSGEISPAERRHLEELMHDSAETRDLYLKLVFESSILLTWAGHGEPESTRDEALPTPAPGAAFLGALWQPTIGYFSSGWPVAYLVAAVIVGVGLIVAARLHVSQPQVAQQSVPLPSPLSPLPSFVGRITGMVDCQWANPNTAAFNGAQIPLGRKCALVSGLMEITYDCGTKVILQGPCTYEVESKDGGYLSVGKLTARVEKKEERRTKNEELSDSRSSFLIPHSYFSVRTPTAIVTDLGTEFGVEVSEEGNTKSRVFQGVVEVQLSEDGQTAAGKTVRLTENESVQVEKGPGGTEMKVHRDGADGATFVRAEMLAKMLAEQKLTPRQRWQAYSQQMRKDPALLAYYTFEGAGRGDNRILPNMSSLGSVLDGRVDGGDWVDGRLPGKYALYFRGPGSGDRVVLPEQDRFNFTGPFSLSVWFKVERLSVMWQRLVAKGDMSWVLQRNIAGNDLGFFIHSVPDKEERYHEVLGQTNVADSRWHQAVVVYDPVGNTANMRLYMDGCLTGETTVPAPLNRDDAPVQIGSISKEEYDRTFSGWIDEVAILTRAISPDEVAEMFKAGNPGKPTGRRSSSSR